MSASGRLTSILVADDEAGFRDLFRFALEPLGYEVVAVSDGVEAIERLSQRPFDLVVLDVHMPRMAGPETLRRIRGLYPEQRVIIISSGSDPDQAFESQAMSLGASLCLFKPVDFDELLAAIERTLGEPGGAAKGRDRSLKEDAIGGPS